MAMIEHLADGGGADDRELGSVAARAVLWNYVSFASGKILVLVTLAVLARLLTPADFGIVGFATLALAFLGVFKDLGLGGALIQRRDDLEESAQTVFTLNLILSTVLAAITALSAPLVAGFFDEPMVTPILRVLSMSFIIEAIGSIHIVLLRRNLDFRRKLIPDVGRSLVKGAVAITLAALGFGAWSLVWGQMAGVVASAILSWVVVPWRPTLAFHRRLVRPLLGFGLPLVFTDMAHAVWLNIDYVVVGRILGGTSLGIYTLAYRLPELIVQSIWRVISGVVFPFFSTLQHDLDLLRRGLLKTFRYSALVVVPLCFGLLVTAGPAVRVLFGDQWSAAIPVMRVLALFTLVASIGFNIGDVYKAIGRPDILAKLSILDLVVLAPAMVLAARHGLVAVAWTHVVVSMIDTTIRLVVARHFIGVTFRQVGRELAPPFAAGMALLAAALAALWATSAAGDLASLLAATAFGALAYLIVLMRIAPNDLHRMASWVGIGRRVEGTRRP